MASNVISQPTSATTKLNKLLKFASIKGFMKGTTLFRWPWKYMVHPSMIWIVSSGSVPIFSTIDDPEIIYPYIFAFNFSSSMLVLIFSMF